MGSIPQCGLLEIPSTPVILVLLHDTTHAHPDCRHQRYVALKIPRADCYGGPERVLLSKITETCARSKHEGRHFILPVLHQFKHAGPNGVHVCFVFDVLGHHLYFQCSKYEDGRLPVRSVKLIARQLLLGLDFLHTECGVVHTGTVKYILIYIYQINLFFFYRATGTNISPTHE